LREYWKIFGKIILAPEGDEMERQEARQYQDDRAVATSEFFFWHIKCIT